MLRHGPTVCCILLGVSVVSAQERKSEFIYFCQGSAIPNSELNNKKRYGVKVSEGRRKTISIRAYDWPADSASFKLERGSTIEFPIVRTSSGGLGRNDPNEGCAKYGWDAANSQYRIVMCTATQGVSDIRISELRTGRSVFEADCDIAWSD